MEFDFTVVVKPGCSHQRADHLSKITNGETPIGVSDDLPNATLFMVETAPRWSEGILEVLSITTFWPKEGMARTISKLEELEQYVLLSGCLYRYGPDKVL